jgi:hypothetical protein
MTKGIKGAVDQILDSEEYLENFGYDTVPYHRNRVVGSREVGDTPFNLGPGPATPWWLPRGLPPLGAQPSRPARCGSPPRQHQLRLPLEGSLPEHRSLTVAIPASARTTTRGGEREPTRAFRGVLKTPFFHGPGRGSNRLP